MYFILTTFCQCIFHCKSNSVQIKDTSEVVLQTNGFILFEVITETTVYPRLSKSRGRLQIETSHDFNTSVDLRCQKSLLCRLARIDDPSANVLSGTSTVFARFRSFAHTAIYRGCPR